MSYIIKDSPAQYLSAHGDIVYVVHETTKANAPTTYPNFKYVADVYIGGVMVSRLKIVPDPVNHFGVFNIGNIVRNYVDSNFTGIDIYNLQPDVFDNHAVSVEVKFGYEYGVTPTLYTNILTDTVKYFNYYTGRLVGSVMENLSVYLDQFATSRPLRTSVLNTSKVVFMPYFSSGSAVTMYVDLYNAAGALIDNNDVSGSVASDTMCIFNVSPYVLNDYFGFDFTNVAYYTVTMVADDPPPGWAAITYRYDLYCEPRYTQYTLHFLNRLGGYESYSFSKVSKRAIDITKKDFTKLRYSINSSGMMSYNDGAVMNDDKVTYFGNFKERLELNSDWLTQDQLSWLSELVKSPQVYIEDNGYLVPFAITDQAFEYKQRSSDRHFNLKIAGEYGDIKNVQYR
jgi:hypothetical protein